jgi:uncharacterized protein (TIGR03067 family)
MPGSLRRFLQFSLRTLFALMVAVAVLFAWLHFRNEQRWRHEESMLEGQWECIEWNAADPLFTLTLNDGSYTWVVPGSTTPVVGRYVINPFEEPKSFDLIVPTPGGARLHGIYRFEADTLTIVHEGYKKERPKNFEDWDGKYLRMVFRRVRSIE